LSAFNFLLHRDRMIFTVVKNISITRILKKFFMKLKGETRLYYITLAVSIKQGSSGTLPLRGKLYTIIHNKTSKS